MNKNGNEIRVAGASFFDEKHPPNFVALPFLSAGFIRRFGERSLENVIEVNGSYLLRSTFRDECEIALAEVKRSNPGRRRFVSRIQIKGEEWPGLQA